MKYRITAISWARRSHRRAPIKMLKKVFYSNIIICSTIHLVYCSRILGEKIG